MCNNVQQYYDGAESRTILFSSNLQAGICDQGVTSNCNKALGPMY